MIKGLNPKLE